MSKYLFLNIDEMKTHIGGGANVSIDFADIEPVILTAAEKHLIPWLGDKFWQKLIEDYPAGGNELIKFYPLLQRALAHLSMYEYLPIGRLMFTGNGLVRVETDKQKTAYKYQENEYARAMQGTGYDALERALKFLLSNADDYPNWKDSDEAGRCSEGLLNWSSEFRLAYNKGIDRYTFETLLPQLRDVETAAIVPLLGEELHEQLRQGVATGNLQTKPKKLVKLIRKALCNATMEEALKRQWVQLRGTNVVVPEKLEPQSYEKEASPTGPAMSLALRHEEEWAKRHLINVVKYLRANLDDFPNWVDPYPVVEDVVLPEVTRLDSGSCNCSGFCTCSPKSVIRL